MGVGHGEFELPRAVAELAAERQQRRIVGLDGARLGGAERKLARRAAGQLAAPVTWKRS